MIPGEKLILHGRRSISASCKALELECRDEDFQQKRCVCVCVFLFFLFFFRSLKNLGEDPDSGHLARPTRVWSMAYSSNRESLYRGGVRTFCGRPEQPSPAKGLQFRA